MYSAVKVSVPSLADRLSYPYYSSPILTVSLDTRQVPDWRGFRRCANTYPLRCSLARTKAVYSTFSMGTLGRLWLVLHVGALIATGAEQQQTKFVISRPMLISFFLDYTDKQIDADGSEALADFVFYLPYAEDKLRGAGIEVHAVFKVKSFDVKVGRRWRTVRPRVSVGYYFIAPGREPEIEFGVEDTGSIIDLARKYFKLPALSLEPEVK